MNVFIERFAFNGFASQGKLWNRTWRRIIIIIGCKKNCFRETTTWFSREPTRINVTACLFQNLQPAFNPTALVKQARRKIFNARILVGLVRTRIIRVYTKAFRKVFFFFFFSIGRRRGLSYHVGGHTIMDTGVIIVINNSIATCCRGSGSPDFRRSF